MKISISKSANAENFFVVKSVRKNGKSTSEVVERLGNLEQVKARAGDEDPYVWAKNYAKQLTEDENNKSKAVQVSYDESSLVEPDDCKRKNIGYLFLQKIYYELGLKEICNAINRRHSLDYDINPILSRSVYRKILSNDPEMSVSDFAQGLLEETSFTRTELEQATDVLCEEKDYILSCLYKYGSDVYSKDTKTLCCSETHSILCPDSAYFYNGDTGNDIKYIDCCMELISDGNDIPLSYSLSGSGSGDGASLKSYEEKIFDDFSDSRYVACRNIKISESNSAVSEQFKDRYYISSADLRDTDKERLNQQASPYGWKLAGDEKGRSFNLLDFEADRKFYDRYYGSTFYKEDLIVDKITEYDSTIKGKVTSYVSRRMIIAFTLKQAEIDRASRQNMLGKAADKGINADECTPVLCSALYDGLCVLYTNLPAEEYTAGKIIDIYNSKIQADEFFGTDNTAIVNGKNADSKRQAQLLTDYIALLIVRILEYRTKKRYSYRTLKNVLKDMNICAVNDGGFVPDYTRTAVTDELHNTVGFRTDYEYLSRPQLKKFCSETKKGIYD